MGPLWGLRCLRTGQGWYSLNIVNVLRATELLSVKWLTISYFTSIKKTHFLHSQHTCTFTYPL